MDAADVVASLQRWLEVATRGRTVADKVEAVEATDDYDVRITMNAPYAPLLSLLAFSNSAAAIYPEEIVAGAGDTLPEVVGTGPYQRRRARAGPVHAARPVRGLRARGRMRQRGMPGKREQTADEIRFVPVPDPNTRVEGLLSGQFDYRRRAADGGYDRIEESDVAEPLLLSPFGWPVWAINHKDGLLTDRTIRQALQAALPIDDMLFAAFGDDKFFVVDGPMYPEGWAWRAGDGTELYNQNDPQKAAELLKEAGYDGTPLRILTSRQYEFHYKMAEVAKMALEAAGFNVQMDVVDWATLGQRRDDPALWDIYITHSPFLPEPALTDMWFPSSRIGWSEPDEGRDLRVAFTEETDQEKRKELFAAAAAEELRGCGLHQDRRLQRADGAGRGSSSGVPQSPWPFFWNATLSE